MDLDLSQPLDVPYLCGGCKKSILVHFDRGQEGTYFMCTCGFGQTCFRPQPNPLPIKPERAAEMDLSQPLTLTNLRCPQCGVSISPHFFAGQESTYFVCGCGWAETFHRPRDVKEWGTLPTLNDLPIKPRKEYSAKSLLTHAADLVSGSRAAQHGPKERNHQNIADHWNAYLGPRLDRPLSALDVALMMAELKIARAKGSIQMGLEPNPDNFVDLAGYAGVAGEIALNGGEEEK